MANKQYYDKDPDYYSNIREDIIKYIPRGITGYWKSGAVVAPHCAHYRGEAKLFILQEWI